MALQYRIAQHYDNAPQIFPEIKGDRLSSLDCRTFRKFIALHSSGVPVIDLGCGTGRVGRYLSKILRPGLHISLELSAKGLALSKALGSYADKSLYIRGDVMHLPLKKIKYCVCHGVIHYAPDTDLAINEIASCVISGGLLYLTAYSKSWYTYLYKFFAVFRILRQRKLRLFVELFFCLFFFPRYLLRVFETKSFQRDFNIRSSFEDFVMTPHACFLSEEELRFKLNQSGLKVIDYELLNYRLLHCYLLQKA